MFFQILSTIKAKLVDEVMQSGYLCVILRVTHKNYHLSRSQSDFLFLVKSKMAAKVATIAVDVTGLQQRHHP